MAEEEPTGARGFSPWEWTLWVAAAFGSLWTIVAQFYDPSAGYSFPMPSVRAVIEIGAVAIIFILSIYIKYGRANRAGH